MLASALVAAISLAAAPQTFRVDYFHTGTATEERFAVDRLVLEPLPWPGNPARPVDDTNLGKYLFEVRDLASNRVLYSRGFASIYGEWETTEEARKVSRTFSESLRFPAPARPVQVTVKKRDAGNAFREVWSLVVDPKDQDVDTARPTSPGPLLELLKSGDPADQARPAPDRRRLHRGRARQVREGRAPAGGRSSSTRSRSARGRPTSTSGGSARRRSSAASRGRSTGVHRRRRVGATYDAFGSERYVLSFDNRSLRDVASFAPYDASRSW